jgi:hypothetical protein
MKKILIYRHPHCERCARFARLHHAVDWFDRIADTTATPPTGPLRMGEIVVQELSSGRILRGADALALIYRQAIPYWFLMPLLWTPGLRARMDREVRGVDRGNSSIDGTRDNSTHMSTRA